MTNGTDRGCLGYQDQVDSGVRAGKWRKYANELRAPEAGGDGGGGCASWFMDCG